MSGKVMSRILSFSTDKDFANQLEILVKKSGYRNRSMFLRDASIHFSDSILRGDLSSMDNEHDVEGTVVIYYQHGIENKLLELRHSHSIDISSYNHNCLTTSHTCVDTMQIKGEVKFIRDAIGKLQNTKDVDRIEFIVAPIRDEGCC